MALRLLRRARRTPTSLFSLSSYGPKTLIQHPSPHHPPIKHNFLSHQSRGYISEMRKSAFEDRVLRLIRNEVQYELDRSPLTQLIPKFRTFTIDARPGEQWIRLNKESGDNEEIKIEVTMFEGSAPPPKNGGIVTHDDVDLYVSMVIDVFKDEASGVLEFVCNAWPESLEIEKVFMRDQDGMTGHPYLGPPFGDLDDELQASLYDFLETRGINDELAVFLYKCMHYKRKNEYVRWMESLESFVARKK